MDRWLDGHSEGPVYLSRSDIAGIVVDVLRQGSVEGRFKIHSYVVMANHVHILVRPERTLYKAMNWIKGVSARRCNLALGLSGQAFWQAESYDHAVRQVGEFERIAKYIEMNPVRAGLVERPELWRWSSAYDPRVADEWNAWGE